MNTTQLAWRLLRGGGRRGILGSTLTLAAVTLVTGLLLFAVAGNHGFAERGERTSWRLPQETTGTATALEAVAIDHVDQQAFTRVDLAATGTGTPPIPPGMDHFPEAGEVWVSPALFDLMDRLPADQLADRFPDGPSGQLGDAALTHPDELVAIVGYSATDPVMTGERSDGDITATPINRFNTVDVIETYDLYQAMMAIATVLMVVPLLVFGGAAARLTVARRDQRLASLRLIGATPGQVVGLTVIEAMITAAIGAVLGTVLYALSMPLLARIPIDGGHWYISDLWPGFGVVAAVIGAVPLLVGMSAVVGLRRVVVSPLGVARRQTPPGLRAIRLVVLIGLIVAFIATANGMFGSMGGLGGIILLALLGGVFLAMNYVGPWIVSLVGRITAGVSGRASTMLAGRRLVDDPRSAWRTVAGVALTGFVAGFIALLAPAVSAPATGEMTTLSAQVAADQVPAVTAQAEKLSSTTTVSSSQDGDYRIVDVTTPYDRAAIDSFRTAAAVVAPGLTFSTDQDHELASTQVSTDIQTGVIVVLSVSMLIAMVSAGVAGASSVLDRRQTYALLHLSGTPMKTLDGARRKETLIPLLVMGGGSIFTGLLLATPFTSQESFTSTGMVALAATIGLGLLGILAASALSRPLLRSVAFNAAPRPD